MKKQLMVHSFSIKNINPLSNIIGVGMVMDGIITEKDGFRNVIFSMTEKEIIRLMKDLSKITNYSKQPN